MSLNTNIQRFFDFRRRQWLLPAVAVFASMVAGWSAGKTDEELAAVRDGFEARRNAAFEDLRGNPLRRAAVRDPLGPGRAVYARHFSYALIDFAMRALWNDEQPDAAAAALIEYGDFYAANRGARNDRDSFYWPADVLCRIVELFGRRGTVAPGRLPSAVEDRILDLMWLYAKENSYANSLDDVYAVYRAWRWNEHQQRGFPPLPASAEVPRSGTWDVLESENHHLMKVSTLWHFCKLLAADPAYRDRPFDDGLTASEHFAAWTAYAEQYLAQRARKGLFIEMGNCAYGVHTLKGIYNFHDFGGGLLQERARMLLDLYFATWAQEQIDGVRGGGKSRVYASGNDRRGASRIGAFMWFYLGLGRPHGPAGELATVATSTYRLPLVVMDLILDVEGRGVYEIRDRAPGLAERGYHGNPHYRLRTDLGGVVRTSFCTPEFIIGLPVIEARPSHEWTLISSQNTWRGVIFAGHNDARIVPQAYSPNHGNTYNQQWGVQHRGTMITQQLPRALTVNCSGTMRVWFSHPGLRHRREVGGWVCVEADGAYAAVRPARGGYRWADSDDRVRQGDWMVLEDGFAPVIIEVARKVDYADYQAFQDAVLTRAPQWSDNRLDYTGLSGIAITFHADCSAPPEIDGAAITCSPPKVFDSPFVSSEWDSALITIAKDARSLVLDFRGK